MAVRVTRYSNLDGSYFAVQLGSTINGRWNTAKTALRAEFLFSIEKNMTSNDPGEYKRAVKVTKAEAEKLANEWRQKELEAIDIDRELVVAELPKVTPDVLITKEN